MPSVSPPRPTITSRWKWCGVIILQSKTKGFVVRVRVRRVIHMPSSSCFPVVLFCQYTRILLLPCIQSLLPVNKFIASFLPLCPTAFRQSADMVFDNIVNGIIWEERLRLYEFRAAHGTRGGISVACYPSITTVPTGCVTTRVTHECGNEDVTTTAVHN